MYRVALAVLVTEDRRTWQKVFESFVIKAPWWKLKYIEHNKAMAAKGLPNAQKLVARVTQLRMKA